ncbi:MAG: alpha/beta hydrolase [Cyclobacteriaceae bacterium]|nr:alpha/beta hydrolase [Cyclobacteriaceae bacterium]
MEKSILTAAAMTATLLSATAQGHYKEYGSTDKSAILIIHGFPGNATDWEATAKGLSDHYRVIVPDLIGFGNNAQKDLPFDQVWLSAQTENLIKVVQKAGLDSFSIIAHDFGVPIAITLMDKLNGKVKKLIITAGNTLSDPPLNIVMKAVPKPIIGGIAKGFLFSKFSINMMRTMGTKKGKIYPVKNSKTERQALKTIFATALENMSGYFMPVEKIAEQAAIETLIIWGDKDPFFPVSHAERMKEKMKNAKLIVYEGVGHYCYIEETSKFVDDIQKFISL